MRPFVSPDVAILTRAELAERENAAFQRGVNRGRFEKAMPDGDVLRPRPLSEWSEENGDVLWWCFPIREVPYIGSPLDQGRVVEVEVRASGDIGEPTVARRMVGGWPGYHTHWTPIPVPKEPAA